MNRAQRLALVVLAVTALTLPARADESYNYTLSLLGGIGGSLDADPDPGLTNPGFALGLAMVTEPRTHVGLRLGQLEIDQQESFGGVRDAELRYALITGEYRLFKGYYDSGLFAGIGGYQLEGTVQGADYDDSAFGGVVGVSGEFAITRWLGFQVELAAHWANLDAGQILVLGHAGVALHW